MEEGSFNSRGHLRAINLNNVDTGEESSHENMITESPKSVSQSSKNLDQAGEKGGSGTSGRKKMTWKRKTKTRQTRNIMIKEPETHKRKVGEELEGVAKRTKDDNNGVMDVSDYENHLAEAWDQPYLGP